MKFEDNLKKLEDTVRRLESGELNLDEMIRAYEEGRALASACSRELEAVHLRLEKVTSTGAVEEVKA